MRLFSSNWHSKTWSNAELRILNVLIQNLEGGSAYSAAIQDQIENVLEVKRFRWDDGYQARAVYQIETALFPGDQPFKLADVSVTVEGKDCNFGLAADGGVISQIIFSGTPVKAPLKLDVELRSVCLENLPDTIVSDEPGKPDWIKIMIQDGILTDCSPPVTSGVLANASARFSWLPDWYVELMTYCGGAIVAGYSVLSVDEIESASADEGGVYPLIDLRESGFIGFVPRRQLIGLFDSGGHLLKPVSPHLTSIATTLSDDSLPF